MNQNSLFDKSEYDKTVAYFALIERGYYLIDGVELFVTVYGGEHEMKYRHSGAWLIVARAYETSQVGVFNYYTMKFHPSMEKFYYELMAFPAKYKAAYGRNAERCGECNRSLELDRSKHYGIGTECEAKHPYQIEVVDEQNGGLSWEELNAATD